MTSTTIDSQSRSEARRPASGALLGFGNVFRKEVREWRHGRRAIVVLIVTTLLLVLTATAAAIANWVVTVSPEAAAEPPQNLPLDALSNVARAVTTGFIIFAAIFASMSLMVSEREKGTLAWTLSKPVTRTSVFLAKWLAATSLLWLVAGVLPIAITAAVAAVVYGDVPDPLLLSGIAIAYLPAIAIFTAIAVTAGAFVRSQAAVGAIAVGAYFLPSVFAALVPSLGQFMPTDIDKWGIGLLTGQPASFVTPIAWAVAIVAILWIGRRALAKMEF